MSNSTTNTVSWISLPSDKLTVLGLPFTQGKPWQRFDSEQEKLLPKAVVLQARFAAGARIRFYSDCGDLYLRAKATSLYKGQGVDLLVDGRRWNTAHFREEQESEVKVFEAIERKSRLFELYLPAEQAISISAVGLTSKCQLSAAPINTSEKNAQLPLVFYGSSITQGSGSHQSSMNYPAILSRKLDLDFVNFGFYGAGRGEAEVIAEIVKVPAKAIFLDLGKSYGKQPGSVYSAMLKQIRDAQPLVPIYCISPIFCLKESYNQAFRDLSNSLRQQFSKATEGITNVLLISGLDLLGENDWQGMSNDGLHPNEYGFMMIASRLGDKLGSLNTRQ